jgi:hypothetical protein
VADVRDEAKKQDNNNSGLGNEKTNGTPPSPGVNLDDVGDTEPEEEKRREECPTAASAEEGDEKRNTNDRPQAGLGIVENSEKRIGIHTVVSEVIVR